MSHAPKTAALMAYESGSLSKAGRARVDRHLRACTLCQRELATIQTYEATVDAIRDDRGPSLDWSKMELALEREAQLQAKKHRRGWLLPAAGVVFAAAAAALLAMQGGGSSAPTTLAAVDHPRIVDREPSRLPDPTTIEAPPMYADAVVTLVAGSSEIRSGAAVASASTGVRLAEDDVITTTDTSSMHARLTPGLAVALEPGTEVRLASLDAGDGESLPQLGVAHGRLAASVHSARTVILAGEFRIEAEVASFAIDFDAERSALTVDVRDGEVHITGPSVDERLTGPGRFPTDAAALDAPEPVGASAEYDTLASVHVARPGIVRWQIGDVGAVGSDQMAMRAGAGPTTISGWDARGRLFRATVTVGADGLDLSPDELRPEAPRIRAGVLTREQIVPVVRQHQRDLQRCYEHELRGTTRLAIHVDARISVDMTGSVADEGVRFVGDDMPPSMTRCMTNQIQTWIFPAPDGGPVSLSLPFSFEPPQ